MSVAPHIDSAFMTFVYLQKLGVSFTSVPPPLCVPYYYILWSNERLGFNNFPYSPFLCVTF